MVRQVIELSGSKSRNFMAALRPAALVPIMMYFFCMFFVSVKIEDLGGFKLLQDTFNQFLGNFLSFLTNCLACEKIYSVVIFY